ncbi:hypothetical protein GN956_G17088 [Arapaima gigas]
MPVSAVSRQIPTVNWFPSNVQPKLPFCSWLGHVTPPLGELVRAIRHLAGPPHHNKAWAESPQRSGVLSRAQGFPMKSSAEWPGVM